MSVKENFFTIIMATYNSNNHFIEKTLKSLVTQKYINFEFIWIDGNSKLSNEKFINKYKHIITYYLSKADSGISEAWNRGISASKGDYISFLGAGDVYLDDALENYNNQIIDNNYPDYISSKVAIKKNNKRIRVFGKAWKWNKFKWYMNVAHVGSFQSKTLFDEVGLYDHKIKVVMDYELLLRKKNNLITSYINKETAIMEFPTNSDFNFLLFKENIKIKKKLLKLNTFFVYTYYIYVFIKTLLRKLFWY